jgi:hypothetical protein
MWSTRVHGHVIWSIQSVHVISLVITSSCLFSVAPGNFIRSWLASFYMLRVVAFSFKDPRLLHVRTRRSTDPIAEEPPTYQHQPQPQSAPTYQRFLRCAARKRTKPRHDSTLPEEASNVDRRRRDDTLLHSFFPLVFLSRSRRRSYVRVGTYGNAFWFSTFISRRSASCSRGLVFTSIGLGIHEHVTEHHHSLSQLLPCVHQQQQFMPQVLVWLLQKVYVQ